VHRSCGGAEGDLVTKVVEAAGKTGDEAGVVAALAVGSSEIAIVLRVAQHGVGGGEQGGRHRDDRIVGQY
jgi:hypothetical protein